MGNFLVCPQRDGSRVSVDVCLKKCEIKHDCDGLKGVSKDILIASSKRLGLSTKYIKEIEAVIQVEEKLEPESEEKIDSIPPIQPLTKEKVAKEPHPVSEGGVKNGKEGVFDTDVVEDLARNSGDTDFTEPRIYHFAAGSHTPERPTKSRAMILFNRAIEIRQEIGTKFLEMGEVLHLIAQERCYPDFGYEDEESFCEAVLNIKGRTAAYLRSIYCWQIKLEISGKAIAEIGWAKTAQILPVSKTKKDAMEWIEKAKEPGMTTQTLNTRVRIAQGKITEEEAKILPIKVLLSLSPDQKEIWDRAINVGKKVTGSESVGYVVTGAICPEFLATYPDDEEILSKVQFVSKALKSFEIAYKVKVLGEIIDESTGEILGKTP